MELNTEMKQQLNSLLSKPQRLSTAHIPLLENLIQQFPSFQALHLLLAKASQKENEQNPFLAKASLYNGGHLVHQLLFEEQEYQHLNDIKITHFNSRKKSAKIKKIIAQAVVEHIIDEVVIQEEVSSSAPTETFISMEEPISDDVIENASHTEIEEIPFIDHQYPNQEELETLHQEKQTTTSSERVILEDEITEKNNTEVEDLSIISELEHSNTEDLQIEPQFIETIIPSFEDPKEEFAKIEELKEIEEIHLSSEKQEIEVFAGIENLPPLESELEKIFGESPSHKLEENLVTIQITEDEFVEPVVESPKEEKETESKLSDNFFSLDTGFISEEIIDEESNVQELTSVNHVSKYDDENLPFSFLWWLAKTRENHHTINRPFANPEIKVAKEEKVDNLQHQYVEHIFHLDTSIATETESSSKETDEKHQKENDIIESFIKNDPQIKPPKPNQINNENKAKKSAEDNYDLVSETLAEIYIEQMLFHKAIDTYEKLSLKFPEKSRYFANLIKNIKKKI